MNRQFPPISETLRIFPRQHEKKENAEPDGITLMHPHTQGQGHRNRESLDLGHRLRWPNIGAYRPMFFLGAIVIVISAG